MSEFRDLINRQIKYCNNMCTLHRIHNKDNYWYYIGMENGFIEIIDKKVKIRFEDAYKYKYAFNYLKGYLEAYKIALSYTLSIKPESGPIRDNY